MAKFHERCVSLFGSADLYNILKVDKSSTEKEIKRAYYRISLEIHPDRVNDSQKAEATEKFQVLGKIYEILSDKEKRAIYDETGEIDEEISVDDDRDWTAHWRLIFPKINLEQIKDFEKKYKGSEEELKDLKTAYLECKGDIDLIMMNVLCCTYEDEDRFVEILKDLIAKEGLPAYAAFTKETKGKKQKRKRMMMKEAKEAEKTRKTLGLDDTENGLVALIQQRQKNRQQQQDSFFKHLEEKYGKEGKKSKTLTKSKSQKRRKLQ